MMFQITYKVAKTFLLLLTLSVLAYGQEVIVSKTFTVEPGKYAYFSFYAPTGGTSIKGRFRAQGGGGNDIEAFIVDQDGFENYSNGHRVGTYFNSGRVTVGTISATLNAGRYYLIFNNGFSVFSNKVVEASVVMESYSPPRESSPPLDYSSARENRSTGLVARSKTRLLTVRSAPTSRAPVVGQVRKFDKIFVRRVLGRWTEIEWNGSSGYVLSRYVGY